MNKTSIQTCFFSTPQKICFLNILCNDYKKSLFILPLWPLHFITSSSSLSATQTSARMMRAGLIWASKPADRLTLVLKAHQASNQIIRAHQNNLKLICVYRTNTIITLYYNNMRHYSDFLALFLWCYQTQRDVIWLLSAAPLSQWVAV